MMGIPTHGMWEFINWYNHLEKQFILLSKIENMCIKSLEISHPGKCPGEMWTSMYPIYA